MVTNHLIAPPCGFDQVWIAGSFAMPQSGKGMHGMYEVHEVAEVAPTCLLPLLGGGLSEAVASMPSSSSWDAEARP